MAEEIAFENGRISNFQRLVILTLDQVTMHTVVHHSLPTLQISLKLKKLFVDGGTDICTYKQTHFIMSTQKSQP